jgi:hypothetical protein
MRQIPFLAFPATEQAAVLRALKRAGIAPRGVCVSRFELALQARERLHHDQHAGLVPDLRARRARRGLGRGAGARTVRRQGGLGRPLERGTVLAVNPQRQAIVVAVDGDSCAVFELATPAAVEVGHRLRGRLDSDLCFALENLTTSEMLDVVPKGQFDTLEEALRAAGL